MRLWSAISRLLTVLAVVGLVAGALTAPAKAGGMTDGVAVTVLSTNGMPCCDPPQTAPDHCRDMKACPFAALCAAPCMPQGVARAVFSEPRVWVKALAPLRNDRQSDSFASSPLGHPPKA